MAIDKILSPYPMVIKILFGHNRVWQLKFFSCQTLWQQKIFNHCTLWRSENILNTITYNNWIFQMPNLAAQTLHQPKSFHRQPYGDQKSLIPKPTVTEKFWSSMLQWPKFFSVTLLYGDGNFLISRKQGHVISFGKHPNTPPWWPNFFGCKERGVCHMFSKSPRWGLSKNIWHPFCVDRKVLVAIQKGNQKHFGHHKVGGRNPFLVAIYNKGLLECQWIFFCVHPNRHDKHVKIDVWHKMATSSQFWQP